MADADAIKRIASDRNASGKAPLQGRTCCPTQGSCSQTTLEFQCMLQCSFQADMQSKAPVCIRWCKLHVCVVHRPIMSTCPLNGEASHLKWHSLAPQVVKPCISGGKTLHLWWQSLAPQAAKPCTSGGETLHLRWRHLAPQAAKPCTSGGETFHLKPRVTSSSPPSAPAMRQPSVCQVTGHGARPGIPTCVCGASLQHRCSTLC